jgi:TPR repeat protein
MRTISFFAAVYLLVVSIGAIAQQSRDANGDVVAEFSARLDFLNKKRAAESGDAKAQFALGGMYFTGNAVVAKDPAQAFVWFRKAAEQGNAAAQTVLGSGLSEGTDIHKNAAEAAVWFRKAAEQGYADAQYNFGVVLANGNGVPKDAVGCAVVARSARSER